MCEKREPPPLEASQEGATPRGDAQGVKWIESARACTTFWKGQRQPLHLCSTIMILPQVHLRKPCYDFYFL
jgi:hypothetical protein